MNANTSTPANSIWSILFSIMVSTPFPLVILACLVYWPSTLLEFFLPAAPRQNIASVGSMMKYHMIYFFYPHSLIFYYTYCANTYPYIIPTIKIILLFVQSRAFLEKI